MSNDREAFLNRVRQAVAKGNRAGAAPLPSRDGIGYQGDGGDPIGRFRTEFAAAGGFPYIVTDEKAARDTVMSLVRERGARRVLLGDGDVVAALDLPRSLQEMGVEAIAMHSLERGTQRESFFGADVGVSGVDYLIAETGSIALLTRPDQPRSLSLLPPVHVAVARRAQILPDLFDLFEARLWAERQGLPSCLSLITGPSKTGDIELRLVTGVHGPGEVHVVLIDDGAARTSI